jgi:hypothetical protein
MFLWSLGVADLVKGGILLVVPKALAIKTIAAGEFVENLLAVILVSQLIDMQRQEPDSPERGIHIGEALQGYMSALSGFIGAAAKVVPANTPQTKGAQLALVTASATYLVYAGMIDIGLLIASIVNQLPHNAG